MSNLKFTIVFMLSVLGISQAIHSCKDPSGSVGHYIGRDQECAALVQTNCAPIGLTSTWKKGVHVKENCATIPALTAIATFLGPNGSYDEPNLHQHTAIFVKCETTGIRVWDQWNGTPIGSRVITWGGGSPQYTGNNFWTIA